MKVLNPEAIGNPNISPVVQLSADEAAALRGSNRPRIVDFNVLYRAAKSVAEACRGGGEYQGRPYPALEALEAQLERLRPAFDATEVERNTAEET